MFNDKGWCLYHCWHARLCCNVLPQACEVQGVILQRCSSGWVSKKQQHSRCTGDTEGLGFLPRVSFRSPLKVRGADEATAVKKEIQREGRGRAAASGEGQGGGASLVAMRASRARVDIGGIQESLLLSLLLAP